MLDRKATTARIRTLEGEVGTKRSRVNNLVEILAGMEHEDAGVVKAAMHSLRRLFTGEVALLDKAHPPAGGKGAGDGRADSSAERKYRGWLAEKYAAYKQSLSTILSTRADKGLQTLAVVMLMQLFKLESERKIDGFSVDCTKTIPRTLIKSGTPCSAKVIKMFVQNFASEYADVRYYSLKMLAAMLSRVRARSKTGLDTVDAAAVDRALVALLSIQVPKSGDPGVGQFWCASETATPATAAPEERETGGGVDGPPPKKQRRKAQTERGSRVHQARSHRKAFGDCWMELLQMRGLSVGAYRLVLLHMHDQILPNIPHPLLLSDFLTDAYSHGGALSMLSMHGLFILMSKHGLEYPHFFRRLYALLIPSVFHLPHRDQFFKLTDLFLTSKGLPVATAAAFIKRMARLTLTAPPAGALLMMPIIYNVLQRHPMCKCLIHREHKRALNGTEGNNGVAGGTAASADTDPFDADHVEPDQARALDSSLWELEILRRHFYPPISKFAKVFSGDFTKPKYDVDDFTGNSYANLFSDETTRMCKTVPLEHAVPASMVSDRTGWVFA